MSDCGRVFWKVLHRVAHGAELQSQYQTMTTPVPPRPNTSVPPDAATEMLISFSRPTSDAKAAASAQRASHDLLELENRRD